MPGLAEEEGVALEWVVDDSLPALEATGSPVVEVPGTPLFLPETQDCLAEVIIQT